MRVLHRILVNSRILSSVGSSAWISGPVSTWPVVAVQPRGDDSGRGHHQLRFGFLMAAGIMALGPGAWHCHAKEKDMGQEERMEKARAALAVAWEELRLDVDRASASTRRAIHPDRRKALDDPPSLSWLPNGGMQAVMVLPAGTHFQSMRSSIISNFAINVTQRQTQSQIMPGGELVFTMEASTVGEGSVSVVLQAPPQGATMLTVNKQSGAFTDSELTRIIDVARDALQLGRETAQTSHASTQISRQYQEDEILRQLMNPGSLFSGLQWMLEEVARVQEMAEQASEGGEEYEGSEQRFHTHGNDFGFLNQGSYQPSYQQPPLGSRSTPSPYGTVLDGHDWGSNAAVAAVQKLRSMGAQVFPPGSKEKFDWGVLAGYESQKRQIEDCLLYPLLKPEVYSRLAEGTRVSYQSNRPRGVLFEGPPGTGKTTSAKVISSQASVPLIYVPLEAVLSKWYGESEGLLSQVFKAAEALGGAILFFDELDALGGNRENGDIHEVSRRMLSVMLREMDGFDARKSVVIGATNRKADLDPALLSRFDMVVTFGLPDEKERRAILQRYARHLTDPELSVLAKSTADLSGRDLRDVAEQTERRWASKIIRSEVPDSSLPPLADYLESAGSRRQAVLRERPSRHSASWRLPPYVF